jgi:hypothetical protein
MTVRQREDSLTNQLQPVYWGLSQRLRNSPILTTLKRQTSGKYASDNRCRDAGQC